MCASNGPANRQAHVSFYRLETMVWLADHFDYRLEIPRREVALFYKEAAN
jgi:hypothetical protein